MLGKIASALNPWAWLAIGVAVLALVSSVALHFRADNKLRASYTALTEQAGQVIQATRQASGNDDVTWKTTAGQIVALGESNRNLKASIRVQNEAIDDLAREAVRLKAQAKEMQEIARRAKAQRAAALERLSDMALEPGTRSDCLVLLAEAEEALDIAAEALK